MEFAEFVEYCGICGISLKLLFSKPKGYLCVALRICCAGESFSSYRNKKSVGNGFLVIDRMSTHGYWESGDVFRNPEFVEFPQIPHIPQIIDEIARVWRVLR